LKICKCFIFFSNCQKFDILLIFRKHLYFFSWKFGNVLYFLFNIFTNLFEIKHYLFIYL